ncbi:RNA polymerase sigma factor [Candidatus Omnitrophota bacterium]
MDDLEFVQRCVKGDKPAWDEFVTRYSRLIYSYIYSVLKIKGSALAKESVDDLLHEIFVSLIKDNFKKLKTFKAKNGCSLASWLRQVTINRTIDYVRRVKPVISIDEERKEGFSLKDVLADTSRGAADISESSEKISHLKDCISRLDKDDKYFLALYLDKGLSLEELKRHLKISRGAVDMRKLRIIGRLRDCFKNKGFVLDF